MAERKGTRERASPCQMSCLQTFLLPSELCDISASSGIQSCKMRLLRFPLPGTAERKEHA